MRSAPKAAEFFRYPVVSAVGLGAIGVTLAWWAKVDITPLMDTAMIRRGQFWRLITDIFPHVGVLHLIFNLYWLWVFGTLVEEVFGHLKTAALILLFAVGSSALEFAFANGGVGLSGVGYGLFGLLWVLSVADARFRDAVDQRTIQLFVVWFVICIVTTVTKIMPVANIAHGAGALLGALTGWAITRPTRRIAAVTGIGAILVFGFWAATLGRPRVNQSASAGYEEAKWGYDALMSKNNQEAIRWLRDAVIYQPKVAGSWNNLGSAYYHLGDKAASIAAYHKAAELGDANAAYYLATLYVQGTGGVTKDSGQALLWYRKAAEGSDATILNNVAWEYATSGDPAIRNPVAALELARKAVDLEKDKPDPALLDTLAAAYYVNSRYEDAVDMEQQAIGLASPTVRRGFQERLKTYQSALRRQRRKPGAE